MARVLRFVITTLAILGAFASSAGAQPYVYAATTGGVFSAQGSVFIPLAPRLVTFDTATGEALTSLTLTRCGTPTGIAVKPDGSRVYVTCAAQGSVQAGLDSVLAIDPGAKQIVGTVTFAAADPTAIAVTPDGLRAVVALTTAPGQTPTPSTEAAAVIDLASLTVTATVPLLPKPAGVAVAPDGARAYVTTGGGTTGSVEVIDLASLNVVSSIALSARATGIAISADGARLAVVTSPHVTVIPTSTLAAEGTIPVSVGTASPHGATEFAITHIAMDAGGTRGYVPVGFSFNSANPAGVKVLDLDARTVVATLPPSDPRTIANTATTLVHVSTFNAIATVSASSSSVQTTGPVVGGPSQLAVAPAGPAPVPDPCSYAVNFTSAALFGLPSAPPTAPAGSTGPISIVALPDRCTWMVQTDAPWITFDRTSGTATAAVIYTIAPNTSGATRTGTIAIGGQTLSVTQAGCSDPIITVERPIPGNVSQPYRISGWAIDRCALPGMGTGLEASSSSMNYGAARPDVAVAFGAQFVNSGFDFRQDREQAGGPTTVFVSLRSLVTGQTVSRSVNINVLPTQRPFGFIDSPAEGAVVSGDMPLTGWLLDDFPEFHNVVWVYRHAVPGEASLPGGRIFVGTATRVPGARPDVQAAFPGYPLNDRAGWGFNVLTNMLPNGGNGTFTFEVFTTDWVGNTWLGPRTVTVNNAGSPLPFGAIDTPAPGDTVSGVITIHGWALTPQPNSIPADGSSIDVYIDDMVVGHPVSGDVRPDVQALFPTYANAGAAGAHFSFDTRTLSNGLHTLAWVVRDSGGNAKGIGSRFFTVSNPAP
jgi:DNA-binding beta-propeller fold protein YncE